MALKQLNKIIIFVIYILSINSFSQMKMVDIENKKISVNSETEKKNLIEIFEDSRYIIYYVLDRKDFNLKNGLGTNGIAKIIFFSKKYSKGILVNFSQTMYHTKKNTYEINLRTGSYSKYMLVSSMAIIDKDFNYEYFMKYYYMPPPPLKGDSGYKSWIAIQDTKNYCNITYVDLKDNVVYENIDDILSNIVNVPKNEISKRCDPIIYDIDIRDYFPEKILK
ncbi:hypothetical protein [Chryseobacterium shandongense]|uniref:hypothetical protein n=1 Tax=Chryseobacterium shandongense TaxID=1493872 RepID=UPI000F50AF0C|nr:hypothetical protein [Chryseobacterium shandongense]AZA58197.1 hypothetical protein EG350_13825 [Chryseobacterium shandongense]